MVEELSHSAFALTDPGVRLSRTRLFPEVTASCRPSRPRVSDPRRWYRKALEHRFEAVPGEVPGLLTALRDAAEPDASNLLMKRAQRAGVIRQPTVGVVAGLSGISCGAG